MKNLIVQLRLYSGKVNYDENRNVTSRNQLMKLPYGTLAWKNFIKSAKFLGYSRVDIVQCLDGQNKEYPKVKTPQEVQDAVDSIFTKQDETPLTPDQQRILDLEARLEAIDGGKKPAKKAKKADKEVVEEENTETESTPDAAEAANAEVDDTPNVDEELDAARAKYKDVFGKKAHHTKSLKKINADIEKELAKGK